MGSRHAPAIEPFGVRRKVVADGGHDESGAAEHGQVIGDISGTAAEVAAQRGRQERDVQHVDALSEDMVAEPALEHHHGVVGHRAADQSRHVIPFL